MVLFVKSSICPLVFCNLYIKTLPIAIVASEDQKFPNHFDFDSLYKALTENRKQTRGASTISQPRDV